MKKEVIVELISMALRVKHCEDSEYQDAYMALMKRTQELGLEWDCLGREKGRLYTDYILRIPDQENSGAIIATDGFSSFGTVMYLPEERARQWVEERFKKSRLKRAKGGSR